MFGFVRGVTCEECKRVVARSSAQRVPMSWEWHEGDTTHLWYCPEHRRPYDYIERRWAGNGCWSEHFLVNSVEVHRNGELRDARWPDRRSARVRVSDLEARPVVTLE